MSSERGSRTKLKKFLRKEFLLAASFMAIAIAIVALSSIQEPLISPEVKFTDASQHGLAIVPASVISTPPPYTQGYYQGSYSTGYAEGYYEGSYGNCGVGQTWENGQCVQTSCSAQYECGQGSLGNNLYYIDASCNQSLVQTCSYQCSAGVCLAPPSVSFISFSATNSRGSFQASGNLEVVPNLVKPSTVVYVYWDVGNIQSCTVTGSNGDSWSSSGNTFFSGAAGEASAPIVGQTVYTLSCTALPGATPATISETATVNIVPSFNEQ